MPQKLSWRHLKNSDPSKPFTDNLNEYWRCVNPLLLLPYYVYTSLWSAPLSTTQAFSTPPAKWCPLFLFKISTQMVWSEEHSIKAEILDSLNSWNKVTASVTPHLVTTKNSIHYNIELSVLYLSIIFPFVNHSLSSSAFLVRLLGLK